MGEIWTKSGYFRCPYCHHDQVVQSDSRRFVSDSISLRGHRSPFQLIIEAVACANVECAEISIGLELTGSTEAKTYSCPLGTWHLIPRSSASTQPNFIPLQIRNDYNEACLIADLSPKASATLARRCLQGMIRDFCGIKKNRLIDEIEELRSRFAAGDAPRGVTPESIEAIDHVRGIGNIGAHMEKDVDLIVDIEPQEAQITIQLIEMLFKEWYIARETRRKMLTDLNSPLIKWLFPALTPR